MRMMPMQSHQGMYTLTRWTAGQGQKQSKQEGVMACTNEYGCPFGLDVADHCEGCIYNGDEYCIMPDLSLEYYTQLLDQMRKDD